MKPETAMSREGKTRIVEDDHPPLKVTFYKEVYVESEREDVEQRRAVLAFMEIGEDFFQLLADTRSELLEKITRLLQAYTSV